MDRFPEKISVTAAVSAGVAAVAAVVSGAPASLFRPAAVLSAWAGGAAVITAWRFRLARREEEELQDQALRQSSPLASTLFEADTAGEEPFSAARARRILEAWVIPLLTPIMGVFLTVMAWMQIRAQHRLPWVTPDSAGLLPSAGIMAAAAFVLYVLARYLGALSRPGGNRPLRAPAAAMVWAAAALAVDALALAVASAGEPRLLAPAGWTVSVMTGLAGVESLVLSLLAVYRPRGTEEGVAAPMESRIGGWIADPHSAAQTAAASLDYQFGFRVSETWFYRFAERALLPLVLFQILVLYGLSCLVFIAPEEQGLRERMGRPVPDAEGGRLEPGAHVKWPWPFETVRRQPVGRLQTLQVGFTNRNDRIPDEILWARPHFEQEDRFITAVRETGGTSASTAAPVGLMSVNLPVIYRISDLRAWVYGHHRPEATLLQIAGHAVTREAAGRELDDILGPGQRAFEQALRRRIQEDCARQNLGVEIVFVGLGGVHPPVAVVPDFEGVAGAMEEREARALEGRTYAARRVPTAEADAERIRFEAVSAAAHRSETARAEADSFETRLGAMRMAPSVYRGRARLATLLRALNGARLFVIADRDRREILQFNFEDRTPSSLFDWSADEKNGAAAPETKP